MPHYSRTTLRELKKRYLNVLKKCLLANLMAVSFISPVQSATNVTTSAELIDNILMGNTVVVDAGTEITPLELDIPNKSDITIYELTKTNITDSFLKLNSGSYTIIKGESVNFFNNQTNLQGSVIYNEGTIFTEKNDQEITFSKNKTESLVSPSKNLSGVIHNVDNALITFENAVVFGDLEDENQGNITKLVNNISQKIVYAYGASIYNSGIINFNNVVEFGNNIVDVNNSGWKSIAASHGGAIYNASGNINFYNNVIFSENKAIFIGYNNRDRNGNISGGFGGAISVKTGSILFNEGVTARFIKNSAKNIGGAIINNQGTIYLNGNVTFGGKDENNESLGNTAEMGGAIGNISGEIILGENSNVDFINNSAQLAGGAVYNEENKFITMKGSKVSFVENMATDGGAIYYYYGSLEFNGDVEFLNNSAKQNGGAIFQYECGVSSNLTFGGNVTFRGNTANGLPNDIYYYASDLKSPNSSQINFTGGMQKNEKGEIIPTIASIGGGIASSLAIGTINKTGVGNLVFEAGSINNNYTGVFNQSAGRTIVKSETFLSGTNNITGGELAFQAVADATYGGTYNIKDTIIDLSGNGIYDVTLSGTTTATDTTIDLDVELNHEELKADKLKVNAGTSTVSLKLGAINFWDSGKGQDNGLNTEELKATVLEGAVFETAKKFVASDVYEYYAKAEGTDITLKAQDFTDENSLSAVMKYKGDSAFNLGEKVYKTGSDLEIVTEGEKWVTGKGVIKSVIDAEGKNLFKVETGKINIKNITLENSSIALSLSKNGIAEFENVVIGGQVHNDGQIATKGKVVLQDNMTGSGDIEIKKDSTLDIQSNQVQANTLTVGENAILGVTLNGTSDYGKMLANTIKANEGAGVHLTLGGSFEPGTYNVFGSDNGYQKLELVHNNIYTVIDKKDGSYLFALKDKESIQEATGSNKEEAEIISGVAGEEGNNESFNKVREELLTNMQSLDKRDVKKALKATSAMGSNKLPIKQTLGTDSLKQINQALSAVYGQAVAMGRAGGEGDRGLELYVKGMYDKAKSTGVEGFKAHTKGSILGVDTQVNDRLRIGVGYVYSNSVAKDDLRRTEVDTNGGFAHIHYKQNAWFIKGLVSYNRSQYEEEKQILSYQSKAEYDVDTLGLSAITGYVIKKENISIVPMVGLSYLNINQEGSTDGFGTTTEEKRLNYLTALAGVKTKINYKVSEKLSLAPSAGVMFGYDVISDDDVVVNTLSNGSQYITKGEALEKLSTAINAGLEMNMNHNTSIMIEYSGAFRKEYQDHSGMLRLKFKF